MLIVLFRSTEPLCIGFGTNIKAIPVWSQDSGWPTDIVAAVFSGSLNGKLSSGSPIAAYLVRIFCGTIFRSAQNRRQIKRQKSIEQISCEIKNHLYILLQYDDSDDKQETSFLEIYLPPSEPDFNSRLISAPSIVRIKSPNSTVSMASSFGLTWPFLAGHSSPPKIDFFLAFYFKWL